MAVGAEKPATMAHELLFPMPAMFSDLIASIPTPGSIAPTPAQAAAAEATREIRATAFDIAVRLVSEIAAGRTEQVFGGATPAGLLDAIMIRAAADSGVEDRAEYLRRLSAHLADFFAGFGVSAAIIESVFSVGGASRALRDVADTVMDKMVAVRSRSAFRRYLGDLRQAFIEMPDHGSVGEIRLFDGLRLMHRAGVAVRTGATLAVNKRIAVDGALTFEQRNALRSLRARGV